MARFLADENFPYPVTEELRRLGCDVAMNADSIWQDRPKREAVAASGPKLTTTSRLKPQMHASSRGWAQIPA